MFGSVLKFCGLAIIPGEPLETNMWKWIRVKKETHLLHISWKGHQPPHFLFLFVYDIIIISKQLGYPFLFLQGRNSLFQIILEALMINFYLESFPREIRMTKIHIMKNIQHFIFIGWLDQMVLRQCFGGQSQRSAIFHENIPNAFPRGITFQYKGLVEVRETQNQSSAHSHFHGF